MKPAQLRKSVAVALILGGLCWFWFVVVYELWVMLTSPPGSPHAPEKLEYLLFIVPILLLMGIPGLLWSYFGLKLYREMSESSLSWVLGILAVVAALWFSSEVSEFFFPPQVRENLGSTAGLSLAIPIAVPAYLFSLQVLLPLLGGPRRRALDFVGRNILQAVAVSVYLLLHELIIAFTPREPGFKSMHKEPWESLSFLVPLGVAYGCYKASQSFLARRRKDQEAQAPQLPP